MRGEYWMNIRNDKNKDFSISEIARKYNLDRETVRKYIKEDSKPKYTYTRPRHKMVEDYADYINELLNEVPYSAVRIKEQIEEYFNIKISYTHIQKYVKNIKGGFKKQATVRFETMPGLQAQVDWGFFENYLVKDDWKNEKKLYCFLIILGYSRMRHIEFVSDMATETLNRCHLNAFNYFGGYPQEILYENMKQVVIKKMLKNKDSELNKTFEDFVGIL